MATTTYVGFFRPTDDGAWAWESWRNTGAQVPAMREKVVNFPASLPPTCKLIGSWAVSGGQVPSVMVVEVESFADLQHINEYYNGWLHFDWHPTRTGGVSRS